MSNNKYEGNRREHRQWNHETRGRQCMYISFYERIGRPYVLVAEAEVNANETLTVFLKEDQTEAVKALVEARSVVAAAQYTGNLQQGSYQYKGYGTLEDSVLTLHVKETFLQRKAS